MHSQCLIFLGYTSSQANVKIDTWNTETSSILLYGGCVLQGLLLSCNQMSADYLFMQDKLYDVQYDTGDKVIQCGRHNDIFKLWLQWRAKVSTPTRFNRVVKPFYIFPHSFLIILWVSPFKTFEQVSSISVPVAVGCFICFQILHCVSFLNIIRRVTLTWSNLITTEKFIQVL